MFIQTLKEVLSIITLFARSIMERIGFRNRDGIFYSATALKKYLDKQPANSPDKPITVTIKANMKTLKSISACLISAGKYVNLDLNGSILTAIPERAFNECTTLAAITMPDGLTSIGNVLFDTAKILSVYQYRTALPALE
jgi:hypothetical protein